MSKTSFIVGLVVGAVISAAAMRTLRGSVDIPRVVEAFGFEVLTECSSDIMREVAMQPEEVRNDQAFQDLVTQAHDQCGKLTFKLKIILEETMHEVLK